MRETRTWEQMRRDNIGAAWINKDGNFCNEYKRTSTPEVMEMLSRENLPEWKKTGFNGCWSCDRCIECHFAKEESTMKKSNKMTGYNDLKAWMERQYGASRAEVTITCNGQTYIGHMYGSDECFDGDEFYQYFLTDDALLRMYYNIPDGCTDFGTIDYGAPYDIRFDDAQYWIDYVI